MSTPENTKEVAAPVDFGVETTATPIELRNKIEQLEAAMFQMVEHQVHIEPVHHFADGTYCREITIPKGTTLTGKIHKTEHINIISKGDISVLTENGIQRIKAPCTIVSKPGTKRVGFAHEDTVWTTVHATNEKDLEQLELELIAPTHEDFERFIAGKKAELALPAPSESSDEIITEST
jgi:hypothetical protein